MRTLLVIIGVGNSTGWVTCARLARQGADIVEAGSGSMLSVACALLAFAAGYLELEPVISLSCLGVPL